MKYEKEFLEQFQSGSSKAFNTVFFDFSDSIYQFCYFRLDSSSEAEDLVEDIFAKILNAQKDFDFNKASIKTWIFNIARNTVIDYLRSKKSTAALHENIVDESVCSSSSTERSLNSRTLQMALQKLSDSERELCEMRFIEDLSYEEIANILGKTNGAIRVNMSRTLSKLKQIFVDMGIDSSNIFE